MSPHVTLCSSKLSVPAQPQPQLAPIPTATGKEYLHPQVAVDELEEEGEGGGGGRGGGAAAADELEEEGQRRTSWGGVAGLAAAGELEEEGRRRRE